jgi:hypothetical protein
MEESDVYSTRWYSISTVMPAVAALLSKVICVPETTYPRIKSREGSDVADLCVQYRTALVVVKDVRVTFTDADPAAICAVPF